MNLKDIEDRKDIHLLVSTFYELIRKNELLGPIFNTVIKDWDLHLILLTDFWESNLFFNKTYYGDPIQKHIEVDARFEGKINELHFGTWINLWHQTIDDLYKGETANIAKNRARNMATFIHISMFKARK